MVCGGLPRRGGGRRGSGRALRDVRCRRGPRPERRLQHPWLPRALSRRARGRPQPVGALPASREGRGKEHDTRGGRPLMWIPGEDILELRQSGLFDAQWYASTYRDVALLGMDPAEHFLRIGAAMGRRPGPGFDTAFYLESNPDVAASGDNPLLHYLRFGRLEGRPPRPRGGASFRADPEQGAPCEAVDIAGLELLGRGSATRRPGTRTLLVCAHVAGEKIFGGERSLLDMLDVLQANGLDSVVSVPGQPSAHYLEALLARTSAVYRVPQSWWRDGEPIDEQVVARFAALIHREGIDAVHVNTIMLREPLEAGRLMGVPAVVHARELITSDEALCRVIGHGADQVVSEVLARCDAIIANSRATAAVYESGGRTFVVPNMVEADRFIMSEPGRGERVRVGMISSNLAKKGVSDFASVARRLQDLGVPADMVLVGPETTATEELRGLPGLPSNLEFAGYREHAWEAIAELDVVVNLSECQESFGRTILEAMAAARPVVVYDWGALPELVADGETGFVTAYRDTAAVAERIARLVSDRELLRALGAAGRRRAGEEFGSERSSRALVEAYEEIWRDFTPRKLTRVARALPEPTGTDRPLRIAYFIWWFPAPSETFVLNELRELVRCGHDVEVFCRQSPFPDFVPDFDIQWTQVVDARDLAEKLQSSRREIVHSHFVYPTVTDMVWPACEQIGVDFTFIAHAQDIFRYTNDARNRIGEIAHSPRCRRVVVPSRFHRDYLLERGVPRRKLFINPNGMDPELYSAQAIAPTRRNGSRRSVCAVHRFAPKKGLEHLIRAAPGLARIGVDVHIYGYGDLEPEYRRLIASLDARNVHLHGPVEGREALLEVFASHDLFACPSVRAADGDMDGIPTVVMEAMAAGLPVMVTPLSGIPELVSDGVNGLYCEPTASSIVDVVGRFFDMPEAERTSLARAARDTVEEAFSTPRLVAGLVRLWRNQTLDVLVVSWNNLPELAEVVRRLQANTTLPWHLVICDNGSGTDVAAWLAAAHAAYPNLTVVHNRDNVFVGPGTNVCLEASASDLAVYVCGKEGFTMEQGWERPLVDYMERHPEVGQAGTLACSPSYLFGRDYPEGVREYPNFRHHEFVEGQPDRRFGHVQGGFFILRRSMIDTAGGFSDAVPHDYTDVEFSVHVEASGWRLGQAPGMLALYNKTRPDIFSRIDESMLAIHPPTLEQLPLLDAIASRKTRFCNVCGWHGPQFDAGLECPGCQSRPRDRTLYRFLAESTLVYRRLLALGIGVGQAVDAIWRTQFRGDVAAAGQLDEAALAELAPGRLDGRLDVVYIDAEAVAPTALAGVFDAAVRLLSARGVLAVRFGHGHPTAAHEEAAVAELAGRMGGPSHCASTSAAKWFATIRVPCGCCARRNPTNACIDHRGRWVPWPGHPRGIAGGGHPRRRARPARTARGVARLRQDGVRLQCQPARPRSPCPGRRSLAAPWLHQSPGGIDGGPGGRCRGERRVLDPPVPGRRAVGGRTGCLRIERRDGLRPHRRDPGGGKPFDPAAECLWHLEAVHRALPGPVPNAAGHQPARGQSLRPRPVDRHAGGRDSALRPVLAAPGAGRDLGRRYGGA
ncbi:glycosyltransferase [Alkalisalibacterium limincola]|uniref:Glycosyltransferase n=1 Tax=Alkalisalibacterium limincola TaxID=2699169 RepID=A0A5C8KK34_9GAMM|nr:glycosyltransferase [Alkalisalibacterium limincola]